MSAATGSSEYVFRAERMAGSTTCSTGFLIWVDEDERIAWKFGIEEPWMRCVVLRRSMSALRNIVIAVVSSRLAFKSGGYENSWRLCDVIKVYKGIAGVFRL